MQKITDTTVIEPFTTGPMLTVTNTRQVRLRITACPAIMLANRRIISAKGLVRIPTNSMAGIIGTGHLSQVGTSGQKISFQYSRVPNTLVMMNVAMANSRVIAMLPVTFAPPGKIGTNPIRLFIRMKKNTVSR